MSRLFSHVFDGTDFLLDPEGREYPDHAAVVRMTLADARSLMSHAVLSGQLNLNERIDVQDENGAVVHSLRFADAVEIHSPPA